MLSGRGLQTSKHRERVPLLSQSGTCPLLLLPWTTPNYAYLFFSFFKIVILKDIGKHRLGLQTQKSPPSLGEEEGWERNNLNPLSSWSCQLSEEELEGQLCPLSPPSAVLAPG